MLIWQEVQFRLWFMRVASNAAEISHQCVFYSSICSVMLRCIPLSGKTMSTHPKTKKPMETTDISLNRSLDWFIVASRLSLHSYFKMLFPLLKTYLSFCNVFYFYFYFFWDFQPLLNYLFSRGAVSLACAANFFFFKLISLSIWFMYFVVMVSNVGLF